MASHNNWSTLRPALAALALVVVACGDGGADGPATSVAGAAPTTSPMTMAEDVTPTTVETSTSDACLDAEDMSRIAGADLVLDTKYATSGGAGLLFCPYNLADDELESLSYTLTNLDPTLAAEGYEDDYEEVAGVGDAALWEDSLGDLTVRLGDRGMIVSVGLFSPPGGGDKKSLAVEIATALE